MAAGCRYSVSGPSRSERETPGKSSGPRSILAIGTLTPPPVTPTKSPSERPYTTVASTAKRFFITTKCPPQDLGRERETIEASLRALGTEYVDLWLVHWPPDGEAKPEMWQVFVEIAKEGKAAAIGVSNYSTAQIDELVHATGVVPAVNQIPWSPSLYDPRRAAELSERGIVLEGYSPLKRSRLTSPVLVEVAEAHSVTPAQVVLRWHLEHGFVVIPKTVHRERMEENFDLYGFELSDDELAKVDDLAHFG